MSSTTLITTGSRGIPAQHGPHRDLRRTQASRRVDATIARILSGSRELELDELDGPWHD